MLQSCAALFLTQVPALLPPPQEPWILASDPAASPAPAVPIPISTTALGVFGDRSSFLAESSFDGRFVALDSDATNFAVRDSLGNPPPANDCSGLWVIDMNEFAAGLGGGNPIPELSVPGTIVDCQWWGRDPGAPFNTSLTNAVEYLVGL